MLRPVKSPLYCAYNWPSCDSCTWPCWYCTCPWGSCTCPCTCPWGSCTCPWGSVTCPRGSWPCLPRFWVRWRCWSWLGSSPTWLLCAASADWDKTWNKQKIIFFVIVFKIKYGWSTLIVRSFEWSVFSSWIIVLKISEDTIQPPPSL